MYSFDWKEENGVCSALVAGGRIVITERRLHGYGVKIKHPSGTGLQAKEIFATWEEAEGWVRNKAHELEQPYVEERLLDVLVFSVEIYQRMLVSMVEPKILHLLEHLKSRLEESLP